MGLQQSASIVKGITGLSPILCVLKWKISNAASNAGYTLLAGQELLAGGGSIVITTNTNACVAKVTINSSVLDVPWIDAEFRDDLLSGNWVSVGNVTNEAPNVGTSLLSFNVAYFNAGGTAVTTNNVNANASITSVAFLVQNAGPKPLTPGA